MDAKIKAKLGDLIPNPFITMKFEDDSRQESKKLNQIIKEEGKNKHAKDVAEKKAQDRQKLNELVKKSNRLIASVSSIFPWNIFPNTLEVEEGRVTIITRQFMSSQSHSVDIEDISNVFIESSYFFATLQIISRTYVKNNIRINYLKKAEAVRTKMIIEGLRTFKSNNINTADYEVDELINKLGELDTHTVAPEESTK